MREPVTDLDHARYDRDGWMETAFAAQRRVAELEAEVARLQHNGDEWRTMSLNNARAADASAKRITELEAALKRIAEHPESYRDHTRSYAVGWAFWNVQNIAKATLAPQAK